MEVSPSPQIENRSRPTADGPVGAVVIVLSMVFAVGVLLALKAVEELFSVLTSLGQPPQPAIQFGAPGGPPSFTAVTPSQPGVAEILLVMLVIACCALLFSCGVGICRGGSWAFKLAIFLFALLALAGNGLAILAGGVVLYCLLRLLGVIGSKPA